MSEAVVFENYSAEMKGREVLRRASFTVVPGEVAAVFGRPGSGKSCIARTLCGLLKGSAGSVRVLERDVASIASSSTRSVSVGLQTPSFAPDLTVHENLEHQAVLWKIPRRKRTGRIAFLTQVLDLEPVLRTRAGWLSEGQRQILEIGRALLPETPVIVLDSLLDHIDPKTRNTIIRHIFETARKNHTAFLITTTSAEVAELCDKIIILEEGRTLAADTPEDIRATAHDEIVVVQTVDNPLLKKRISERFKVVVREEGGDLKFSLPQGDIAAAELLSELDSQVSCVRVRRQTLYDIAEELAAPEEEWKR
ncbi:MAG: ABC transporter ATP-binding protein [Armatimonadota bacterium]|nr:ABC transporter ATP-binding protein [Armatimonadota bacterium]